MNRRGLLKSLLAGVLGIALPAQRLLASPTITPKVVIGGREWRYAVLEYSVTSETPLMFGHDSEFVGPLAYVAGLPRTEFVAVIELLDGSSGFSPLHDAVTSDSLVGIVMPMNNMTAAFQSSITSLCLNASRGENLRAEISGLVCGEVRWVDVHHSDFVITP